LNTHRVDEGFYLAIPSGERFRKFIEQAAAGELASRRSLGIAVIPATAARRLRLAVGLPPIEAPLIRGVDENGPAGRAGLRRGDVVVKAGDESITTVDDLYRALDAAGDSIQLRVVRGTDEIDVLVEFETTDGTVTEGTGGEV
jgi:S1-C subfamily serine protease